LPVIVYFHGGGWILGNERTHDRLIRELARDARAAVVFVKYTPSPEARFPVPVEQGYAATRYVAEHGARFGLDPTRLAIAGDSVGGNMAAVVARLAKERGGPEIRLQALFYPVTDARFDTASYQQFAEGPWLTRREMQWFFDAYAPDPADRERPDVAPLRTPIERLRGLAPALVIVDENDVLRDEGEAYAHLLMNAGVPVKAVRVLGTIHDFMMLNAIADTPPTRAAITLAGAELRAALAR
jgi:acetyl esterase